MGTKKLNLDELQKIEGGATYRGRRPIWIWEWMECWYAMSGALKETQRISDSLDWMFFWGDYVNEVCL